MTTHKFNQAKLDVVLHAPTASPASLTRVVAVWIGGMTAPIANLLRCTRQKKRSATDLAASRPVRLDANRRPWGPGVAELWIPLDTQYPLGYPCGRSDHATVRQVGSALNELEGGAAALLFGSGMHVPGSTPTVEGACAKPRIGRDLRGRGGQSDFLWVWNASQI